MDDCTPSLSAITAAAKRAVSVLESKGLRSCIAGDLACYLYGSSQVPNALLLIVLTDSWKRKDLKDLLVSINSNFYIVTSKNSSPSSRSPLRRILWYTHQNGATCEVRIVLPGTAVPFIKPNNITMIDGLPVAPLSLVLLHQLRIWQGYKLQCGEMARQETNINELLPIAISQGLNPCQESYLPSAFILLAEMQVEEYASAFPASKPLWGNLGFIIGCHPSPEAISFIVDGGQTPMMKFLREAKKSEFSTKKHAYARAAINR